MQKSDAWRRDIAAAESLALAEQAERRCLAEWQSDERIDREHSPPRSSHVHAEDRDQNCCDADSDESGWSESEHEHYNVGSWDSD